MSTTLTPIVPFVDRHAPKVWTDLVFADQDTHDALYEYAHHTRFGHIMLIGDVGSAKSTIAKMIVATRQAQNSIQGGLVEFIKAERIKADPEVLFDAISAMSAMNGNDFNPYVIADDFDCVPQNIQPRVRAEMQEMKAGRLIFTVNDITKIDRSIADRCDCYEVPCPSGEQMLARAQTILRAEHVGISDITVLNILNKQPSMRKMLMALENAVLQFRRTQANATAAQAVAAPQPTAVQGGTPAVIAPLIANSTPTQTPTPQTITVAAPSSASAQPSSQPTP